MLSLPLCLGHTHCTSGASRTVSSDIPGLYRQGSPRMLPPPVYSRQNLSGFRVPGEMSPGLNCTWFGGGSAGSQMVSKPPRDASVAPPYLIAAWIPHPSFLPTFLSETSLLKSVLALPTHSPLNKETAAASFSPKRHQVI